MDSPSVAMRNAGPELGEVDGRGAGGHDGVALGRHGSRFDGFYLFKSIRSVLLWVPLYDGALLSKRGSGTGRQTASSTFTCRISISSPWLLYQLDVGCPRRSEIVIFLPLSIRIINCLSTSNGSYLK